MIKISNLVVKNGVKKNPLDLLTKAEEKKLRENYEINMKRFEPPFKEADYVPVVHFFNPFGVGDWYLSELSPDNIGYGVCDLGEPEIGYVSLDEISFNIAVEKDRSFHSKGQTLREWRKELVKRFYN